MEKTIVGISTALGVGAINIIRLSGNDSIKIVNKIFKGNNLEKVESHTINYGFIIYNEKIIDEVLVSVMKTPKTYTKENIVEINCHGGISTTNKIMEILLLSGCELAEPGEFTKRAFLNGRIDLIEAEGIMDLINAKTDQARRLALESVDGNVSTLVKAFRTEILNIIANIEVNIDYPEYEDIEEINNINIQNLLESSISKIKELVVASENMKIYKNGINTVIIGKPNVGKSSLLNRLINEDKAIVTNIEGTTRDIVEGTLNINGVIINFIDTAGIRQTEDIVEKIGVEKSYKFMEKADLILFLLDNNKEIDQEELDLIEKIKNKNHIVIVNKSDLKKKIDIKKLGSLDNIIEISTNNNININQLKDKIIELFNIGKLEEFDNTYITSARGIAILKECLNNLYSIEEGLKKNYPIDIIEIDLKKIWNLLGEIIGENYDDELINTLFSNFCLGK